MVSDKQAAGRRGILWALAAKFFMDVAKSPGLLSCCVFPVLFLGVFKILISENTGHEEQLAAFLALGFLLPIAMVPGTATVYPMAEAREKGEENTLLLASVGPGQLLVARGLASFVLTLLVGAGCFLAGGSPAECALPFLVILASVDVGMTAFSLLLGRLARDQMAASFLSLPIVLAGIAPMFLSFSGEAYAALPLLPTGGGYQLMILLAEGALCTPEAVLPAIAQLAWAVVGIVALAVVARRA